MMPALRSVTVTDEGAGPVLVLVRGEHEPRPAWLARIRQAELMVVELAGVDLPPGTRYEVMSRAIDFGWQLEFCYAHSPDMADMPVTGLLVDPQACDVPLRLAGRTVRDRLAVAKYRFHGRLEVPVTVPEPSA